MFKVNNEILRREDMPAAQNQEVELGRWLNNQRSGRKAFLKGEQNSGRLQGMDQERLDILVQELPG